jgi:hypothetical protein
MREDRYQQKSDKCFHGSPVEHRQNLQYKSQVTEKSQEWMLAGNDRSALRDLRDVPKVALEAGRRRKA